MKKIYLFLAFLLLIGRLNAQNCTPNVVPHNFNLQQDSCSATSYDYGMHYFWNYNSSYGLTMYATGGNANVEVEFKL